MNDYRLPKNIRQIGENEEGIKIYLEDYVNTFIHRCITNGERKSSTGVLLGQKERINGIDYLFIKGAIETRSQSIDDEEIKKYFPNLVVCGCFYFDKLEQMSRLQLTKMFEEAYPLQGQVLYYIHGQDEEFYIKDLEHGIRRVGGYYVYYERNEQMQAYMKEKLKNKVEVKPREPDIPKESISKKKEIRGKKKKRRENGMLDIVVRTVSLVGIFLLAFVIFSDQINVTKIGSKNKSEVETLPVAASVIESESSSQVESESLSESESSSEVNAVIIPKAYTILKGESIASISLKFYGTLDMVDSICELNEISNPDYVRVGQKIQLPKRE